MPDAPIKNKGSWSRDKEEDRLLLTWGKIDGEFFYGPFNYAPAHFHLCHNLEVLHFFWKKFGC